MRVTVRPVLLKSTLALIFAALLPVIDQYWGIFRGLVGDYTVHHVGLHSAIVLTLIAGVLGWTLIPRFRNAVMISSAAFLVCGIACAVAVAQRAGLGVNLAFAGSGEILYIAMLTSAAFGVVGLWASGAGTLAKKALPEGLEIAHVLFLDVVGYSKKTTDEQRYVIEKLQNAVLGISEVAHATIHELIRLPTGDGMALVFFTGPELPVRCATRLAPELRRLDISVRMGCHTGPVYRTQDINNNWNVTGAGINIAQRVMDCGDGGHILVSKALADVLLERPKWRKSLTDIGETEVKHGIRIHLFNLCSVKFGNTALPHKYAVHSGN